MGVASPLERRGARVATRTSRLPQGAPSPGIQISKHPNKPMADDPTMPPGVASDTGPMDSTPTSSPAEFMEVQNDGLASIGFWIQWADDKGAWQQVATYFSGVYPNPKSGITGDLIAEGVPDYATQIKPYVYVALGKNHHGNKSFPYAKNGRTAVYRWSGSTEHSSVELIEMR